ncbi:MAG: adenylyl-sulfate kinase [bacterium]
MRDKGFTLWFTGLPASGKTTLSGMAAVELRARGMRVEVLDGDVIRKELCSDLGFSREDRDRNVRRVGFVCGLLSRNGVAAIAALISPYRAVRREVRAGTERFVEVYTKCPVEVCMERDYKGNYRRALAGEIRNFTGVDDPYEEPERAEIVVDTANLTPRGSFEYVMRRLEELGYAAPAQWGEGGVYSREEEEKVRRRLEGLGYI